MPKSVGEDETSCLTTLYVVRHGVTSSNIRHKIQGPKNRSRLSWDGKNQICSVVKDNFKELNEVSEIVTSQTLRAKQSGKVVASQLNTELRVDTDESLIDFNPGILTGLTHKLAKKMYPDYYQIWKKHGDLDGIPNSEAGDILQARIIAFLAQYLGDKTHKKELIITHAGVIRCMVNTCRGKHREDQVDIGHNKIYVLKDPWEKIDIRKFDLGKSEMVYKVETADQNYVLKIKKDNSLRRSKIQSDLINFLASESLPISQILYTHKNRFNNKEIIQVMKFIPGENVFGQIDSIKKNNLMKLIFSMKSLFGKYPKRFQLVDNHLPSLQDKMLTALKKTNDSTLCAYGNKLLKIVEERYLDKQDRIVFWDLHRGNILFTNDNPSLIDFECLIGAPDAFQLACLLAACFQLENPKEFKLGDYVSVWPEKVDRKEIIFFMKIRQFLGAAFFVRLKNSRKLSVEEAGILSRYLESIKLLESEDSI